MSETPSDWQSSKGIAKAILHDRGLRRKWMARLLFVTLVWMTLGLWVIDGFLEESLLWFASWWLFCGILAMALTISALYDAVSVMREEQENR